MIFRKSTELLRLLQLKSIGTLGDYTKAVICIDIVSGLLALEIDSVGIFNFNIKICLYYFVF